MVMTFQESVKKIIQWLDTGESSFFHHPCVNVKEIEPGQFLVIDDMEPREFDKNKIIIPEDVAETLVAKLFGMACNNSALVQSIISSTVGQNTGIFIPGEYFSKMLTTDSPSLIKVDQPSKLISSSKNQDVKVVIKNSKRILPSPTLKTVQSAVTNQNLVAFPSLLQTRENPPVPTSKSGRSVLKSITPQTKNLGNSIPNVTFILSKSGKMVATAASEQAGSVKIPVTRHQATPYRTVNIRKQQEPGRTIWNPLTPSPTSNDVMSPEQNKEKGSPKAHTKSNNDLSKLMVELDETIAKSEQSIPASHSGHLLAVPSMNFSNLPSNQIPVFSASNTNQAVAGTVYQHVARSPLDGNVFNIPYENSSRITDRIYVQNGQNYGFVLKKEQVHLPNNSIRHHKMF